MTVLFQNFGPSSMKEIVKEIFKTIVALFRDRI